jgi:hypothetical protein
VLLGKSVNVCIKQTSGDVLPANAQELGVEDSGVNCVRKKVVSIVRILDRAAILFGRFSKLGSGDQLLREHTQFSGMRSVP